MVIPLLTSTDGTDVIVHHQKFSGVFVLGLICLSLGQATTVQAGPLPVQYWAPAAGGGGSGTWTTSGSTWALTSGTTGTAAQNSAAKLIFGNAVGTVTVSGSVSTTATPTGMQLSTSGYLIVGGTIGLTGDITVDQGVTGTITSSIASGANGLIKSGSGTLSLSGSNTNLFGTAINGGTLVLGNAYAISSGSLAVNAGTLDLNGQSITIGPLSGGSGGAITTGTTGPIMLTSSATSSTTFAGSIIDGAGTIAFTKLGSGTLTLSGSNGYTGVTNVNGGAVALGNANALGGSGTITFGGGRLQYSGSNTVDYSAKILGSGSAIAIDTNGQNVTFANGLAASNTGGLTKSGVGTLTLSGSNAYAGPTVVNAGVLASGGSNVLPDSTALTVAGGGLNIGSFSDTVASVTISSGSVFGSGKLTAASYALGGGTVSANLGGGTLTVTGSTNLAGTADVTAVNLNAGPLVLGSAGRFTSNQVTLTGSAGASLALGGNESVGSIAGGFNVVLGSATLTAGSNNTNTTYSGLLGGSGGLTKVGSGKLTLSGSNTYSGGTTISGGTLALSGSGSIGTGGLDLGTNGIFELAALASGTYALPATGNLVGAGTISGNGKTLAVLGSFLPGNSPGTVTVGPGLRLDLSNSGTSVFQITSPLYTAGSFDLVNGTGSVTFGGILSLDFSGGSYSVGTNVLQIFANTGGLSGTFSSLVWTGLAAGQSASFDASTGYITIVPEPSACALITIGGCLAAFARRRRSRRPWPHRE